MTNVFDQRIASQVWAVTCLAPEFDRRKLQVNGVDREFVQLLAQRVAGAREPGLCTISLSF